MPILDLVIRRKEVFIMGKKNYNKGKSKKKSSKNTANMEIGQEVQGNNRQEEYTDVKDNINFTKNFK